MHTTFLSLGSNQGARQQHLDAAIAELGNLGEMKNISSIWKTKAWGQTDQDDFLNIVVAMETAFEPLEFLENIQKIENALGRVRTEKWGPRIIDIDIILWDQEIIEVVEVYSHTPLRVPHPYAHQRAFVLAPLLEIAPDIVFPNGIAAQQYWDNLGRAEQNNVQKM